MFDRQRFAIFAMFLLQNFPLPLKNFCSSFLYQFYFCTRLRASLCPGFFFRQLTQRFHSLSHTFNSLFRFSVQQSHFSLHNTHCLIKFHTSYTILHDLSPIIHHITCHVRGVQHEPRRTTVSLPFFWYLF